MAELSFRRSVVVCVILLGTLLNVVQANSLAKLRKASRSESYHPASPTQVRQAEKLFEILFSPEVDDSRVAALTEELSLQCTPLTIDGQEFFVVHELETAKRGWGFYAFRRGAARPQVLQAPHAFYDRFTGKIVEQMFLEGDCVAAAWNTAHRYKHKGDQRVKSDLCHVPNSVLHSFSRAFALRYPDSTLIQVHGFAATTRRSFRGTASDVILSNGTHAPPTHMTDLSLCLGPQFKGGVAVFPLNVQELGATTNTLGRMLRTLGHRGFLHVELSPNARTALKSRQQLRKSFWHCLAEKCP